MQFAEMGIFRSARVQPFGKATCRSRSSTMNPVLSYAILLLYTNTKPLYKEIFPLLVGFALCAQCFNRSLTPNII